MMKIPLLEATTIVLSIVNIVVIIVLTYIVSRSDDKRIIKQFRYDAYKDFKNNFNVESPKTNQERAKAYVASENEFNNFINHSLFLFKDENFESKLKDLASQFKFMYTQPQTIKRGGVTINFPSYSTEDFDPDVYYEIEQKIIKLKSDIQYIMQQKILKG